MYTNSTNLKSIIQSSNGAWYLDLNNSNPVRTVYLRFTRGIRSTGPDGGIPINPGSANYKVFMYTACNHDNYNTAEQLQLATC